MRFRLRLPKLVGVVASTLCSASALAQDVPTPSSVVELEEIVVVAQKRAQNAQDVGKAINAFTAQDLKRGGIQDVSRLELITPGLAFAQRGNDYKLTLRGANAENTDRAEPAPVGVFVDGLYRIRAAQAGNAFLDVASVEVIKGPQGTLFGRNTLGGAVLINTNKPNFEEQTGSINFTGGNFNLRKLEGIFNFPVSDKFAVRVAAQKTDSDGWIENLGASNDLGEVDDTTFRISALWEPNENLNFLFSHFSYDSEGSALGAFGYQSRGTLREANSSLPLQERQTDARGVLDSLNPRGGALGTRGDLGPWEVFRDSEFVRDVTEETTSLEVNWNVGNVDIKSITAVTDYFNLANVDGDYSEGRLLEESRLDDMDAVSQELVISSANGEKLDWVTGAYYGKEEFEVGFFRNWLGFAGTAEEAAAGTPNLAECGNAFSVVPRAAVADRNDPNAVCPGQFAGNPSRQESSTAGAFLHLTYNLGDDTRLKAGVRYTKDKARYFDQDIFRSTGRLGETTRTNIQRNLSESWSQATWEVGFERNVFSDSLLYGSVSTGFLSGNFNPDGSTFDQQEVIAYEIGLKNRLWNNRLELNLSAYRNEFDDLLAGVLDENSLTVKVNGGSITAQGLEVDLKALTNESLTIIANLSLQDSTYDEFGASNRFQLGGTGPVGFVDLSGLDTPWAPSVSGNLGITYDLNTSIGLIRPHLQLAYSGSHQTTGLQQFALAEQDAYTKVDARVFWQSFDEQWSVQAYVQNLTNEEVLQHTIVGGSDIVQVSWGKPRAYGIEVGYNF